jgi:hypothetical protein
MLAHVPGCWRFVPSRRGRGSLRAQSSELASSLGLPLACLPFAFLHRSCPHVPLFEDLILFRSSPALPSFLAAYSCLLPCHTHDSSSCLIPVSLQNYRPFDYRLSYFHSFFVCLPSSVHLPSFLCLLFVTHLPERGLPLVCARLPF